MHRTRPSSSAAVARAVAVRAPLLDRHVVWLVAGMVVAFLAAALTTSALLAARRVAPVATTTITTTVTTGGATWRTTQQRVVLPRADARLHPRVFVW